MSISYLLLGRLLNDPGGLFAQVFFPALVVRHALPPGTGPSPRAAPNRMVRNIVRGRHADAAGVFAETLLLMVRHCHDALPELALRTPHLPVFLSCRKPYIGPFWRKYMSFVLCALPQHDFDIGRVSAATASSNIRWPAPICVSTVLVEIRVAPFSLVCFNLEFVFPSKRPIILSIHFLDFCAAQRSTTQSICHLLWSKSPINTNLTIIACTKIVTCAGGKIIDIATSFLSCIPHGSAMLVTESITNKMIRARVILHPEEVFSGRILLTMLPV